MKPKLIALYLPQFHQIPENDEFWGEGFTDWVTVKNSSPLFDGHNQPRVPLNDNYYDLSLKDNVEWQSKLASDHGIYGFGVYHYWFNNEKNLLTKPAEIMRDSSTMKTKYFFIWDNNQWKRSWSNVAGNDWAPLADDIDKDRKGPQILIPYILGDEPDWEKHYQYVRTHFFSDNYEKIDNRPVFCIFVYSPDIARMCEYWDDLAKKDGFNGMFFVLRHDKFVKYPRKFYQYNYEPHNTAWSDMSLMRRAYNRVLRMLHIEIKSSPDIIMYDYDKVWQKLIASAKKDTNPNIFLGAFVDYDDTPRRGRNNSRIVMGGSPEKFKKYLAQLVGISQKKNKSYIFLTAWNEWGECAYVEPDSKNGLNYLEAIKDVLNNK